MKKLQLLSASVFALAALSACSDNSEEFKLETQTVSKVDFTINDFEGDEVSTRTVYGKDGQVAWQAGDVIGVFPFADAEGNQPLSKSQVDFHVTEGTASAKTLVFDGGSWALRENWTYLAYYPFDTNNRIDSGTEDRWISGYYGTLTQIGNDDIQHIAKQDYLRSKAATVKNGTVNFEMEHISSILKLNLTLQDAEDVEVKSLSVKTDSYGFVREFYYFINSDEYDDHSVDQTVSLNFESTRTNGTNLVAYIPVCSLKKINSNERWTITAITEKGVLKGTFEPNISTSTFTVGTIYSLKATLKTEEPTSIEVGVNPIEAGCTLLKFIPDSTGLYKIESPIRIDYSFVNETYHIDSYYFFEEGKSYILSLDDSHAGGTVTITQQTLKLGENNGLTAMDFYTFTAPYDGLFGWENCDFWDCPNSTYHWGPNGTIFLNKGQIAIFIALNSTVVIKKADMTTINLNDIQTVSQEQIFSFVPDDDGYYFIGTKGGGWFKTIGNYTDCGDNIFRLSKGQELHFSASPYGEDFKIWIEKLTLETLILDTTTSVTEDNFYEFVPKSDGFYRIVKEGEGYCDWLNVPSHYFGDNNFCAYLRKGESTLLKTYDNCNDLKITLTKVDTQLNLGDEHIETTQGEYFYTFVPAENGIYQVDVNNGYAYIIVDKVEAKVAKLEQGVEYLVYMSSGDNPTTIRIQSAQSKQIKAVGDPLTFENQERYLVQFTPSKSGFYWIESKDCEVRWVKDAFLECAYLESGNTYSFAASPWFENASVTVKQPVDIASTDSQFAVNNGVNYYTFTPNKTGTYRFEADCYDVIYCCYQNGGGYYWLPWSEKKLEFTIEEGYNGQIHIIKAVSNNTEPQQGSIVFLKP